MGNARLEREEYQPCIAKNRVNTIYFPSLQISAVSKQDVKLCALCGTLNHQSNAECWTCRWHGEFSGNEQTISLAWQRLEGLYEEVRLEHVTARRLMTVGDFGAPHPPTGWRAILNKCRDWWERVQTQRDLRSAQREAGLRNRLRSRPDHLGV